MPTNPRWSEDSIPDDRVASWRTLLADQAGVVSMRQLRAHGHSWAGVAANLQAARWQRLLPAVYATFTGSPSRRASMHAALLYVGRYAVLSHDTAAEEWGVLGVADRPVEITVPYASSAVSQLPFVRVHRSRALRSITYGSVLPRTRLAATIVDCAVAQPTGQDALHLVIDLVTRTRVSVDAMRRCVRDRPPHRYRAVIDHGLELLRAGFMSALEVEYATRVEQDHGLPEGQRQVPVQVDGKTLWEDVVYDEHGVAMTVRLDGRQTHAVAGVAFRDMRRDNAAELAGRSRLVYGWQNVHDDPCAVAAEVRTVLVREGWRPPAEPRRRCSRCSTGS